MKVSEILKIKNKPVVYVSPTTTILTAAHRTRLEKVGCVIVSEDGKHPDGIVAMRDIVYNMASHWGDDPSGDEFSYLRQPVTAIMAKPVRSCTLDQNLKDVMKVMWKWHFLHVPVLDANGEMCGVVSIDDVIQFSVAEMETEAKVLHEQVMLSGQRPID